MYITYNFTKIYNNGYDTWVSRGLVHSSAPASVVAYK